MTVYLLFYSVDYGDREDWNTFYTPCEVFDTQAARDARKAHLQTINPDWEYHELENEVLTAANVRDPHN